MLNTARVLRYVKANLGFSFQKLELTDTEILDYIKEFSLRTFSKYCPQKKKIGLNPNATATKNPLIPNEFYIEDPDSLEILNVVEVYTEVGNDLVFGHPVVGVFCYDSLPQFTLQVNEARSARLFSIYDYTFEFNPPNNLRISPAPQGWVTIEYERIHAANLSTVPTDLQEEFLKLSLADIKIVLGGIRKKYGGQLSTPFGNIPLDIDILTEGKEERREVIEQLNKIVPNVVIDIG